MPEVLLMLEVRCVVCDVRLEEAMCNYWYHYLSGRSPEYHRINRIYLYISRNYSQSRNVTSQPLSDTTKLGILSVKVPVKDCEPKGNVKFANSSCSTAQIEPLSYAKLAASRGLFCPTSLLEMSGKYQDDRYSGPFPCKATGLTFHSL